MRRSTRCLPTSVQPSPDRATDKKNRWSGSPQDQSGSGKGLKTHSGVFKAIGLVLVLLCVLAACCVYWTIRAQRSVSHEATNRSHTQRRRSCFLGVIDSFWPVNVALECFDRSTTLRTQRRRILAEAAPPQEAGNLRAVALAVAALARCNP